MELNLHGSAGTNRRAPDVVAVPVKSALRRYERSGNLAIDPKAFVSFFYDPPIRENKMVGNVAVVDICGPLYHHDEGWCDSYDAIQARVAAACGSLATAVVLRVDSPGGEASGCFEISRAIRKMCADAGKPLVAYVEGQALSAGYAIACSASRVVLASSALVGSVGVINSRIDFSAMNAANGIRFAVIASGTHKADGHPDVAITEAELAETQSVVNSLAGVFFDLVAEMRPGATADAVKALEARIFHGAAAIQSGLADEVKAFDALISELSAPAPAPSEESMTVAKTGATAPKLVPAAKSAPKFKASSEAVKPADDEAAAPAATEDTAPEAAAEDPAAPAPEAEATAVPEGFEAFVEQVASTAGVDADTALQTMMGMADKIGGMVRDALDGGGDMSSEAKNLAAIEARASANANKILAGKVETMAAELAALKTRNEEADAKAVKSAEEARTARISAMVASGHLLEEERTDALTILASHPDSFERIYGSRTGASKPVPIGHQQAGAEPGKPKTAAAANAADIAAQVATLNVEDRKAYQMLMNSKLYTHERAMQRLAEVKQKGVGAHAG